MTAPFHRLLSFYSNRNSQDTQTIRLQDSISGNLALGLDFPVALAIAIGRHLWLRNSGSLFSLNIHVPSVSVTKTLLEGIEIDEKKGYSCSEVVTAARPNGLKGQVDAVGLWALAADVKTGRLAGEDVVSFQRGTLFEKIEKRRKGTEQILPLWRGGPISAVGHSWVVKQIFDVNVYQSDHKDN